MEHFNSENLAIFLLAGYSGLDLFQRGLMQVRARCKKTGSEK